MDERELIKRCASDWEDRSLRLQLADFLAAYRDGERAELIRLQLGPSSKQTQWRIKTLLKDNAQRWCGPMPPKQCHFVGGLLEGVSLRSTRDLETLLRWRDAPPIRWLELAVKRVPPRNLQALAESSVLAFVDELTLDYGAADVPDAMAEELAELAASPLLARCRSFLLRDGALSSDGAAAFAGVEMPPGLERLALRGCGLDAHAIQSLAPAPWLTRVRRLDLTHNRLDDAACAALAGASTLTALAWLDVSQNPFGDKGFTALAAGSLAGLVSLRARCHAVGTEGLRGFFAGAGLPALSDLRIGEGAYRLEAGAGAAIAEGPLATQLRVLALTGGRVGDDGCAALFSTDALGDLEQLVLERLDLADKTVVAFAESRATASIQRLSLDGHFGDRGVSALVGCDKLGALQKLKVTGTTVSPDALKALTDRFGSVMVAPDVLVLDDEPKPAE